MIVKWEGEAPPNKGEWYDLVESALGEEAGLYRVVFHREPAGWRFHLERRSELKWRGGPLGPPFTKADEGVVLKVRALFAGSGKELAPDGDPPTAALPTPVIPIESTTTPDESAAPSPAPIPSPSPGDDPDAVLFPSASSAQPTPPVALRSRWPTLHAARGGWALLGLAVVAAAWLARDLFRPSATSAPLTPSAQALSEKARPKPQEPSVAPRGEENETAGRPLERPSPPPRATSPATGQAAARAIPAPEAPEVPTPVPPTTPLPAEEQPSAAAAEGPGLPTAAPVERGDLVDVADASVTRPALLTQEPPRYPPVALRRGIEGSVVLDVLVDETGAVVEASVVRVTPRHMGFEEAATRHVKSRRYRPATKNDVPVRVRMVIAVEFKRGGSR